ncbi:hypothetical protein ACJMK2_019260 [Sinanodonta woodiana]|uniref:Ig-like domain-containing protein n=1 Tax=Sinanodonta woodiana TaxID=1069815 RepID=A0ABD3UFY2_SINWO
MDYRARAFPILAILIITGCQSRLCPSIRSKTDDEKMFIPDVLRMEYVRIGHYVALECCSANYDNITWYRWNQSAGTWMDYLPCNAFAQCSEDKPDIIEDGQVLEIKAADVSDATSYKCIVKDSNDFRQQQFKVNVVACDEIARGPFAIYPNPEDQYIRSFGVDVKFPCLGYFGCSDGDADLVEWLIGDENSENWIEASSIKDNRYNVTFFTRSGGSIIGANLSISNVIETDLRRNFRCVLASTQVIEGQTNIDVKIHMINSTNKDGRTVLITLFALSAIFIAPMLIIALLLKCCNRRKEKGQKFNLPYCSSFVYHGIAMPFVPDRKSERTGHRYIFNKNLTSTEKAQMEELHPLSKEEAKSGSPV